MFPHPWMIFLFIFSISWFLGESFPSLSEKLGKPGIQISILLFPGHVASLKSLLPWVPVLMWWLKWLAHRCKQKQTVTSNGLWVGCGSKFNVKPLTTPILEMRKLRQWVFKTLTQSRAVGSCDGAGIQTQASWLCCHTQPALRKWRCHRTA